MTSEEWSLATARAYFALRRLERTHGSERVRAAYDELPAARPARPAVKRRT